MIRFEISLLIKIHFIQTYGNEFAKIFPRGSELLQINSILYLCEAGSGTFNYDGMAHHAEIKLTDA